MHAHNMFSKAPAMALCSPEIIFPFIVCAYVVCRESSHNIVHPFISIIAIVFVTLHWRIIRRANVWIMLIFNPAFVCPIFRTLYMCVVWCI